MNNEIENLNGLSEGIQILREYIRFSNLNFLKLCKEYDPYDKGVLSKENLKNCLKLSPLYFTQINIEQIYNDAPKNEKKELLYKQLNSLILKAPTPITRFSFKNLYNAKRLEKIIKQEKDIESEISYDMSNFFDKKKKLEFKHYDLFKLEIIYLQTNPDIKTTKEDNNLKIELTEFYKINNRLILENFEVYAAKEIASKFQPADKKIILVDEILEHSFLRFFGINERKKLDFIINDDFKMMMNKLKLSLTLDEIELLRFLIFQASGFTVFNAKTFCAWLNQKRSLRIKDLVKVDFDKNEVYNQEIYPFLLKELIKIGFDLGLDFIIYSLEPFLFSKKKLSLEQLRIFLCTLNLNFNKEQFMELELYLATKGYLSLDNYVDINQASFYIDIDDFIRCLKNLFKELNLKEKEDLIIDDKNAIKLTQNGIYSQIINNLEKKLEIYCDDSIMIPELKLRLLISQEFPQLNQKALNLILKQMNNNLIPVMGGQRKIYLPEFISILKNENKDQFSFQENKDIPPKIVPASNEKKVFLLKNEFSCGFVNSPFQIAKNTTINYNDSLNNFFSKIKAKINDQSKILTGHNLLNYLVELCKQKDYLSDGTIRIDIFKKVLDENFELNEQDKFVILSMAENLSGTTKKNAYGYEFNDKFISYRFFTLQLEKYYLLKEIL